MIDRFEKLEVLKSAHQLVLGIYRASSRFPSDERFGLVSQIRRSAVAIPTNIIEGGARGHRKEYLNFCSIARGSAAELRYLLRIAFDLGYLRPQESTMLNSELEQVLRMLNGLIRALRLPKQ